MNHSKSLLPDAFSDHEPRPTPAVRPVLRGLAAQRAHLAAAMAATETPEAGTAEDGVGPVPARDGSDGSTPIWSPAAARLSPRTAAIPTSSEVLAGTVAPASLPPELEHAMIAVLTRPLAAGEGHQIGNDNRERELCALIATLDLHQAHHLGRRLDLEPTTDVLVQAFRRLVLDRRQRVRTFVANARRRQLLGPPQ